MSDNSPLGFAKFVPGFEFLQNLAKGAGQAMPQMPSLSNWIAPTLSVEELDKRIDELKAVQFWLDQNAKALAATVQALEVQKMTLATLQGMNFSMGDLANALKIKAADAVAGGAGMAAGAAARVGEAAQAAQDLAAGARAEKPAGPADGGNGGKGGKGAKAAKAATPAVDPLQWWGSLTQQFQQIAATAMADAARTTAVDAARTMATGMAKDAVKAATGAMRQATQPRAKAGRTSKAAKAAPRKKAAPRRAASGT